MQAHGRVKLAGAVVGNRVHLGQLVALAFFGHHMQKLRARAIEHQLPDVLKCGDQRFQIMAVNRADVVKTEVFKQRGGHDHALGMGFQALGQFQQGWCHAEHLLSNASGRCIKAPAHQLCQVAVECAHRRADAHVVVVEHHQQPAIVMHTCIVHGFERHASTHGTVANDGHGMAVFTLLFGGQCHAKRGRNRGGGVGSAKRVVGALTAARKAGQPVKLPQGVHALAPTGQYFVRISLVAHIPHQPVFRGVENIVQRDCQLYRAEVRTQMPTGFRHRVQQVGAQLIGQCPELGSGQLAHVSRTVDVFKQ